MTREIKEGHENLLTVTEVMNTYSIKFKENAINLIEGSAGSGKSYFMMNDFIYHTNRYTKWQKIFNLCNRLSTVLWVCDTNMLVDSVINDYPLIAEAKKKGMLIEARSFIEISKLLGEDNGTIKVISYQTLANFMTDDKSRYLIEKYIRCIIMDEFHQLFNYYYTYKNEKLALLISRLNILAEKTTVIGMTATTQPINIYQYNNGNELKIHKVFEDKHIYKLDRHFVKFKEYFHCGWNMIKFIPWEKVKESGKKVLIYTDFISVEEKYKQYISALGLKVEWLCSPNSGNKYFDVDVNTGETIEVFEPTMTKEQIELREYLIKYNEIPKELDVLIINAAYQTGWNLRDKEEKIQYVLIDSCKEDVHIQAMRIRHDIIFCGMKWTNVDKEGRMLYKNGNIKEEYYYIDNSGYKHRYYDEFGDTYSKTMSVYIPKVKIPKDYFNKKLSKEDKDYIVYKYGIAPIGKNEANWKTIKKDLEDQGYIVNATKNGTYIFEKGKEIKKDSKRTINKMDKINRFLEQFEGGFMFEADIKKFQKLIGEEKPKKVNEKLKELFIEYTILNQPSHGKKRWKVEKDIRE